MTQKLKQRLVGAFVLIALAVIFLPSFVKENQPYRVDTDTRIPEPPAIEAREFARAQPSTPSEPAPEPETMFLSADENQPVVDSLAEARTQAVESEPESEPEPDTEASPTGLDEQGEPTAWVVQVASFSRAQAATDLRDRLQSEGFRAYVRSANTASGEVSRVFIGPKLSRAEALETKTAIDQLLSVESLVVRFQP
ncbi:SPOR domain-containing protein [Marinimicrobium alkaliphilum]|uniref:SPOR domain-containing protein n=1 Tax=Marinimicrobium alkaliphilum TaxID=2202654 RepID=UPI000DBAC630|nr:SPOR domain-containing protein [Marinimicrobium alkaliphilum]